MKRFALLGHKLGHSFSSVIHNYSFKQLSIDAVYEHIEIAPEKFSREIKILKEGKYSGFNITIPYKQTILPYIDELDKEAKLIGAVNTINIVDKKWYGYNTDSKGFIVPLLNLKRYLKNALVLGTGGAARAITHALFFNLNLTKIVLAGRNLNKAEDIKKQYAAHLDKVKFEISTITDILPLLINFDLIVNTTSAGMAPQIKNSPLPDSLDLARKAVVYDLIYNPLETKLLKNALKSGRGVKTINGLEMLLAQAALAFKIWTGKEMPVQDVQKHILKDVLNK